MPELPEVEIVRRGLLPALEGKAFESVEQHRPDLRFPLPDDFPARLRGRKVKRLERRGKYLLAHLSGGDVLLMHLGMTGCFTVHAPNATSRKAMPVRVNGQADATGEGLRGAHDHLVFHMRGGATVTYNDPRRFSAVSLQPVTDTRRRDHRR
jgi:formamidopyrimidine-DNA glycosylase